MERGQEKRQQRNGLERREGEKGIREWPKGRNIGKRENRNREN